MTRRSGAPVADPQLSPAMVRVYFVALPEAARNTVRQALQKLWSPVECDTFDSVAAALAAAPGTGLELVAIGEAVAEADVALAAQATDHGLKRWAVLRVGVEDTGVVAWALPASRWTVAELARLLPAAVAQHETLRTAQRAQGDLLTIARRINHEMRSPLGSILTAADVLRDELSETAPGTCELIQPIADSAQELLGLVDQLTFLARATASPGAPALVDLTLVVWAAQERLAEKIRKSGAVVTEPETWPRAVGVAEWIERIWLNLLANAVQHAGPAPAIQLGWEIQGDEGRFFVRDEGRGVPSEEKSRLFRPFHQLHQSDSGRGLGLAVVERLVSLSGGRCGYEPVVPTGSLFYFTLPAVSPPAPPATDSM